MSCPASCTARSRANLGLRGEPAQPKRVTCCRGKAIQNRWQNCNRNLKNNRGIFFWVVCGGEGNTVFSFCSAAHQCSDHGNDQIREAVLEEVKEYQRHGMLCLAV
jgi:hypothetical protein